MIGFRVNMIEGYLSSPYNRMSFISAILFILRVLLGLSQLLKAGQMYRTKKNRRSSTSMPVLFISYGVVRAVGRAREEGEARGLPVTNLVQIHDRLDGGGGGAVEIEDGTLRRLDFQIELGVGAQAR